MPPEEPRASLTVDGKISFSMRTMLLGCLLAAITYAGLTFALLEMFPDQDLLAEAGANKEEMALVMGLMGVVLVILVGPATAYLVGYLMRDVVNQPLHVLAFGLAGALVGAAAGWRTYGAGSASIVAALLGISAMVARAILSPYARRPDPELTRVAKKR